LAITVDAGPVGTVEFGVAPGLVVGAVLGDVAGPVGTTEPTAAPVHGRLAVKYFAGQ